MANHPGRTANDETWTCVSCGMTVMSRGADVAGWKGVQLTDDALQLSWFCDKEVCQEALHTKVQARMRVLRARAGMSVEPPVTARPPRRRLRDILTGTVAGVFNVPPGGFAAAEKRDAPRVEERDGEDRPEVPGGGRVAGSAGVQEGGRGEAGGGGDGNSEGVG